MSKELFEITITVDTNDADYNTKISKISEANLEKIRPLIAAIKEFKRDVADRWSHTHNYPCGENHPREDLGEKPPQQIYPQFDEGIHQLFTDLCPHGEYGFHSVKSVEVAPFVSKTRLL